jgi:cytochrome P450
VTAPPLRFDPYDPALHADPYPVYQRLRDEFPVHYEASRDFYTLSRYDDILAALEDPATFCSRYGVAVGVNLPPEALRQAPLLIMMDDPRHRQLRGLVNRAFTPRRVAELEPRIRKIAGSLLDALADSGAPDLVRDLAAPLPTIVIAELLGVPPGDQAWFKEKSTQVAQFDPVRPAGVDPRDGVGPAMELGRYLAGVLDERRRAPRDDLLSALLEAEVDGQKLTPEELIGFAFLLLVAGNETTTNLISNAAILLDRYPDQRELLVDDPACIPTAVEEFLRYDSPVQGLARTTTRPVRLHGVEIPEGVKVLLLFASANRDPRRIADPERFDVTRDPNPHLAFGFGTHFCLGASLARLEARVAFEELLARLPGYRLRPGPIERMCSGPIRGALRLPISL